METKGLVTRLASVPAYFALRIASGILLLKLSASLLSVVQFTMFAQLVLLASLLNLVAVGGTQNGLIRQAAAACDEESLARTQTAALMIWAVVLPTLLTVIVVASSRVSHILVGTADYWPQVIAIAALALCAGPGQIWCSLLSGRNHVPSSLGAQAMGTAAGTIAAAFFILRGSPVSAAVAFASGSLVTMFMAFVLSGSVRTRLSSIHFAAAEVRPLLRYSAAFAATSGYTAIVLFGLRALYRAAFGPTALGYWMAANRISDMSTQLLGLFMIQFVVAHLAAIPDGGARRRFVVGCWAGGVAMMSLALAAFSLAPTLLVQLFLSETFVPAIPVIRTYMLGDILRVWVSLAMFAAFAAGRPERYAAIEMSTLSVFAAIAIALILAGDARGPQFAYVGAYGLAALGVTVLFLFRWRADFRDWPQSRRWPLHGGRRKLHRGIEEPPCVLPLATAHRTPAEPPRA